MTVPLRPDDLSTAAPMRGPGHRLPSTLAALDLRDALLCEAAARFYPGASAREIAKRLHDGLDLFHCTAWPRERTAEVCPPRHDGRITAFYWRILHAIDHVPSGELIRKIVARPGVHYPPGAGQCGVSNLRR
jgi:hypothetical protein